MDRIDFVDVEGVQRPVVGFAYFRGLLNKKLREVPVILNERGEEQYWADDATFASFANDLAECVLEFSCSGPAITD